MWTLGPMWTIAMLQLRCPRLFRVSLQSIQTLKHIYNDSLLSWGTADGYILRLLKVAESKIPWMKVRNIFRPKLTHCPLHLHRSVCQTYEYATGFSNDEEKYPQGAFYETRTATVGFKVV